MGREARACQSWGGGLNNHDVSMGREARACQSRGGGWNGRDVSTGRGHEWPCMSARGGGHVHVSMGRGACACQHGEGGMCMSARGGGWNDHACQHGVGTSQVICTFSVNTVVCNCCTFRTPPCSYL